MPNEEPADKCDDVGTYSAVGANISASSFFDKRNSTIQNVNLIGEWNF